MHSQGRTRGRFLQDVFVLIHRRVLYVAVEPAQILLCTLAPEPLQGVAAGEGIWRVEAIGQVHAASRPYSIPDSYQGICDHAWTHGPSIGGTGCMGQRPYSCADNDKIVSWAKLHLSRAAAGHARLLEGHQREVQT
jgi:hypothetical protein